MYWKKIIPAVSMILVALKYHQHYVLLLSLFLSILPFGKDREVAGKYVYFKFYFLQLIFQSLTKSIRLISCDTSILQYHPKNQQIQFSYDDYLTMIRHFVSIVNGQVHNASGVVEKYLLVYSESCRLLDCCVEPKLF